MLSNFKMLCIYLIVNNIDKYYFYLKLGIMKDNVYNSSFNKNEEMSKKWMRSKNVRMMLNISDSTLQNMRISGAIPAYKLGSSWFYREDEILEALKKGRLK